MGTLQHETIEVIRATDHDCSPPNGTTWITADGKPLKQGLWYALWLTKAEEVASWGGRPTIWTFLTTGHATEAEARAAAVAPEGR